jgi:hypothetical protein
LLQSRVFETGSVLHDHLNHHIREIRFITQRDVTLDQPSGAILFGHNQESPENSRDPLRHQTQRK